MTDRKKIGNRKINNKKFKDEIIQLSHGDGGIKTGELINNLLLKYFGNEILNKLEDSAVLNCSSKRIAYTTDSFVVNPIFFPGGDIGKLSICGTINDLVTTGCTPLAISLSFILEEGFPVSDFKKILLSTKKVLDEIGLNIVTGDTKVVEKGSADKIFINTSGIGFLGNNIDISPCKIEVGDKILINGGIAEHGTAILSSRKEFNFKTNIVSDCAPLSSLVNDMLSASKKIHALRDATRGGLASILFELARASGTNISIHDDKIPVKKEVLGICQFLGLDPLYIANEGKMVAIVDRRDADKILQAMKKNKYGKDSQIIGEVTEKGEGLVILFTELGTRRILDLQYSEQLPRIC
jgi:hydrogenase expression/formation protein HypE